MPKGCDSALTNRLNPGDEPRMSRHPVLVGMYDEFTDAIRDGQIKCWGKRLDLYIIGDPVTLHVAVDDDTAHQLARELDADEDAGLADQPRSMRTRSLLYDGRPRPDILDFQVLCRDGSALVVRDGHWVRWADTPEEGLLLVDNRGRAVEAGDVDRGAWIIDDDHRPRRRRDVAPDDAS